MLCIASQQCFGIESEEDLNIHIQRYVEITLATGGYGISTMDPLIWHWSDGQPKVPSP